MVFDEKEKKKIGIISFIPAICFFICLVYYLILLIPALQPHDVNNLAVGITNQNYGTLFAMLAVSGVVSAGVLIYFIVLLAKLKNMNGPNKLLWIVVMATFVPVSFPFFWLYEIKREPRYVGVHPDMA